MRSLLLLAAAPLLLKSFAYIPSSKKATCSSAVFGVATAGVKPTPTRWEVKKDEFAVMGKIKNHHHPEMRNGHQHSTAFPLADKDSTQVEPGRKPSKQNEANVRKKKETSSSYPPGTSVRIVRGVHGKTRPIGKVTSETARMVRVHVESLDKEVHVRKTSIEMVVEDESYGSVTVKNHPIMQDKEIMALHNGDSAKRTKSGSRHELFAEQNVGGHVDSAVTHMNGNLLNLRNGESWDILVAMDETTKVSGTAELKFHSSPTKEKPIALKADQGVAQVEKSKAPEADLLPKKDQEQATLKAVGVAAQAVHKVAKQASLTPKNQDQEATVTTNKSEAMDTRAFQVSSKKMNTPPPVKSEAVDRAPEIKSAVKPKIAEEESKAVAETSVVKSAVGKPKAEDSPVAALINEAIVPSSSKTEIDEKATETKSADEPKIIVEETKSVVETSAVAKLKAEASPVAADPRVRVAAAVAGVAAKMIAASKKVQESVSSQQQVSSPVENVALSTELPSTALETTKADVTADTYYFASSKLEETKKSLPEVVDQSDPGTVQTGPQLESMTLEAKSESAEGTNDVASHKDCGMGDITYKEEVVKRSKIEQDSNSDSISVLSSDVTLSENVEALSGSSKTVSPKVPLTPTESHLDARRKRDLERQQAAEAFKGAMYNLGDIIVFLFKALIVEMPDRLSQVSQGVAAAALVVNQTVTNARTAVGTSLQTTKEAVQAQVEPAFTAHDIAWKVAGDRARWVPEGAHSFGFAGVKLLAVKVPKKSKDHQRGVTSATRDVKTNEAAWSEEVNDALFFAEKALKKAGEGKVKKPKSDLGEAMKRAREAIDLATHQPKESETDNKNHLMALVDSVRGVSDTENYHRKTISLSNFNNTLAVA